MSCKDPVKRREKGDEGLRVVLTPLTGPVYETSLHRLQRRNAEKVQEVKRRRQERIKRWKKANPEKVKEEKKRWRERNREKLGEKKDRWKEANPEKMKEYRKRYREGKNARQEVDEKRLRETTRKARERKQRWRKANPEKVKEQSKRYRKANPEKMKEYRKRYRERENARQEVDEERLRETRKKVRERKQRWRKANPEKVKEQKKRQRERKKAQSLLIEKVKESGKRSEASREAVNENHRRYYRNHRERLLETRKKWRAKNREAENEKSRRYYYAHREQCIAARRRRYAKQKGRPVPPPPPPSPLPCDCGLCLACGGWVVTWKPDWYARMQAWSTQGPDTAEDQPIAELEEEEDLPLDLLESEIETLSTASTSEIGSESGDRLETLLADESDSEVETGPATAPTRRSTRIAAMPAVSYLDWEDDPMPEILRRKAKLHSEAADRIVTRWELLDCRTDRVDAIVEEMSVNVDPHHELDKFQTQLERQDAVREVVVNEELFDFISGQL